MRTFVLDARETAVVACIQLRRLVSRHNYYAKQWRKQYGGRVHFSITLPIHVDRSMVNGHAIQLKTFIFLQQSGVLMGRRSEFTYVVITVVLVTRAVNTRHLKFFAIVFIYPSVRKRS